MEDNLPNVRWLSDDGVPPKIRGDRALSETVTLSISRLRTTRIGFRLLLLSALCCALFFLLVTLPMLFFRSGFEGPVWALLGASAVGGLILWLAGKITLFAFEDSQCRTLVLVGLVLDLAFLTAVWSGPRESILVGLIAVFAPLVSLILMFSYQAQFGRVVHDKVLWTRSRRLTYFMAFSVLLLAFTCVVPTVIALLLPLMTLIILVSCVGQFALAERRIGLLLQASTQEAEEGSVPERSQSEVIDAPAPL